MSCESIKHPHQDASTLHGRGLPTQDLELDAPSMLASNHGSLILPGDNPNLLLDELRSRQSVINHHGLFYRFENNPPSGESWTVTRLDCNIRGEFIRGLGTEVFFIPSGLSFPDPLKMSFIIRGFSSNELLAHLEGKALEQFDTIHLEDLNELPDELFNGCLAGKVSPKDYLEMFQKATGIHYRSGVVDSLLGRIVQAQEWYQQGKKIYRPIFTRIH